MSKVPAEVSFEVASWIKSRNIAWAKSKQNGQHLQAAE